MFWLVSMVRVRFCGVFVNHNQVQASARGPHGIGRGVDAARRELCREQSAGPASEKKSRP
jgi:hypothetical protein